ncbi:MAG: hypothetical protein DI563_05270 [Variovorax paradoxus]|uniref:Uncharacterized protein n=1 Tax=Variovorax paradoxus TaxID=34073 RepID=A0A2W5QKR7_VARPD|nr:MAG: hypothetical protein DI563_05270 [Variovorax paradoxus]
MSTPTTTPLAVKYSGDKPPATLRRWCDAHADRVYELHCGGGYDSGRPNGFAYDVMLRPGWSMSDDACHILIEPTVADMLRQLRAIARCTCSDCIEALAKGTGSW